MEEQNPVLPKDPKLFISIIIVGRNEEKNIPNCINSIASNSFPSQAYEIIYVDDHSQDKSIEVLKALEIENLHILQLKDHLNGKKINSYKKEAISYAVSQAKGEVILQTDADTIVQKEWILMHYHMHSEKAKYFCSGPVFILPENKFIVWFQCFDFITTMGVTGAAMSSGLHYLANGANMSFSKKEYLSSNMSISNDLASGDDMFLVQEMAAKHKDRVAFIKAEGASVITYGEQDISSFIKQRIRWAGKSKSYKEKNILVVAALVFMMNMSILVNLALAIINPGYLILFLIMLLMKLLVDYIFITTVANYYKSKLAPKYLLPSMLIFPFYYLLIGLSALVPLKYKWKDRMVR